jgi:hypothetical protein
MLQRCISRKTHTDVQNGLGSAALLAVRCAAPRCTIALFSSGSHPCMLHICPTLEYDVYKYGCVVACEISRQTEVLEHDDVRSCPHVWCCPSPQFFLVVGPSCLPSFFCMVTLCCTTTPQQRCNLVPRYGSACRNGAGIYV